MYFNLALQNVKKSYRDYLIYFVTLMFSVCLFYTFNSFQAQQAVMEINESQRNIIQALSTTMEYVSVFVAIVLAFLILYANNFLIRRRKKELGIYTILGMPKGKISKILVYETFIIGLVSLITGMILGIVISQVLLAVTANLFVVPLNYSFIFSTRATILTIISFSIIFIITMIFNSLVLNRYKLIDLINAENKNDEFKIKKLWISIVLFFISLGLLGWAYHQGLSQGVNAFLNLGPIIAAGSVGTFLFFLSLAGFLLTILKSNRHIYFKNLNCFILRQINSTINTNFISMSIVCIMLLLSIGALSTGLTLNSSINNTIRNTTPSDVSFEINKYWQNGEDELLQSFNLEKTIQSLNLDRSYIKDSYFVNAYDSGIRSNDPTIINNINDNEAKALFRESMEQKLIAVPLSSYNKLLTATGYDEIELSKDEVYVYSTIEYVMDDLNSILKKKPTFNIYGHPLKVENTSYHSISLATNESIGDTLIAFVIDDSLIPKDSPVLKMYWNVNLTDKISQEEFRDYVIENITKKYKDNDSDKIPAISSATKDDMLENSKGMAVIFTYIGIYLGVVFLIASAVTLALQQLSQASDNKKRYIILNKIGTDKKMMERSILTQIAIYFMMPLCLAIIHSIVGIQMVNKLVLMLGRGNILLPSLYTGLVILVIYGSYFIVTYYGYKNILKS